MTRILIGNVVERLCELEVGSVQCVVTSPPYFNLRNYGDHEGQIGHEQHFEDYLERLCVVGDLLQSVLHPTGVFWLNIGDSFDDGEMLLIPHRLAIRLSARGWYVRMDNVWKKTRYMPNGGKNRSVLIHEYVFQFTKQASGYYYNPDAIREPHSPVSLKRWQSSGVAALGAPHSMGHKQADGGYKTKKVIANPLGKLKASVWDICPSNYKGPHYAVMPEQLAETCVLASSRPGDTVLDPFCGSGTTGKVAVKHGRHFIGIDIDPASQQLVTDRIKEAM